MRQIQRNLRLVDMHPFDVLESIYHEHGFRVPCMAETLLNLDVPREDVDLLSLMPWQFPANRIAVERERLGVSAIHPLLHWKLSPPPPVSLTPEIIVKLFDLALGDEDSDHPDNECADGRALVLPA